MPRQITDRTDIKIFILEMLKQVNIPVDIGMLNSIVVQDGYVNSFDFLDCFYELSQTGAIEKTVDEKGTEKYGITEQGKRVSLRLESPIVQQIKGKAQRSAIALLAFSNRKTKISSTIDKLSDKQYVLKCEVSDENGKFFYLELALNNQNKADNFKTAFDSNPEFIYRGILGLLSGDVNYLAEAWKNDVEDDEE